MSRSTLKSIAVGAGVAILLLFVGGMSYMVSRTDGDDRTDATANEVDTEPVETSSTTTSLVPADSGETVAPTTTSTEPPKREFAEHFEDLRLAVATVDTVTCDTVRQGTAFLIDGDLLVTASGVVDNATQIGVAIEGESSEAAVIGRDVDSGVAVLRLSEPVDDPTTLELAKTSTRVGDEVAALVQPFGLPLTMVVGRVVSIDATASSVEQIRTDATIQGGSAGGPVINDRGQVVGLVGVHEDRNGASGPLQAIDIALVRSQVVDWIQNPDPVDSAFCVGDVDLDDVDTIAAELIVADVEHPQIAAIQRTYAVYSQSINSGRAEGAFGVLGPAITRDNTPEAWAEGQRTSKLWDWRIRSVEDSADGLSVRSVFTSTQDSEFGFDGASSCTRWDITHDLVSGTFRGQEYWLINRSRATEGSGPVDCLEWQPEEVARESLLADRDIEIVRSDRLAGGTVHDWKLAIGSLLDGEATELSPVQLRVSVEADGGFDPVIEIYDQFGNLVAQSEYDAAQPQNADAEYTTTRPQQVTIRVRDAANRSGGSYEIVQIAART